MVLVITFDHDCQPKCIPQSLKSLVAMIFGGLNIQTQSGIFIKAQTTLTISQLLQFNSTIRRRKDSTITFHSRDREPPLPICLGLLIHAETRKHGLIEKLYNLGISISYVRLMQFSAALGNSICNQFHADNLVCPAKLRHGLFTTCAVDNIDHNPSSTTAQGSLHGTAISLFQHPTSDNEGIERPNVQIDSTTFRREELKPLPESYSVVPPVVLPQEQSEVSVVNGAMIGDGAHIPEALNLEKMYHPLLLIHNYHFRFNGALALHYTHLLFIMK